MKLLLQKSIICGALLYAQYSTASNASQPLQLKDAIQLTLNNNIEFKSFDYNIASLEFNKAQSKLKPGYEIGLSTEGQGANEEYTLSLESIFEAPQKSKARAAFATSQLESLQNDRNIKALKLIQATSTIFIELIAHQEELRLLEARSLHWQKLQVSLQRQVHAGAASNIDLNRIKAQVQQQEFELIEIQKKIKSSQIQLSELWNKKNTKKLIATGDLFSYNSLPPLENLKEKLMQSPLYQAKPLERQQAESDLSLIKTNNLIDYSWSIGTGYNTDESEQTLEFGVNIPLRTRHLNKNKVFEKEASMQSVQLSTTAAQHKLELQLQELFEHSQLQRQQLSILESSLLPALEQAYNQAKRAYQKGSLSFQDFLSIETDLFSARQHYIEQALALHKTNIAIDVLTELN
ncbi:MAG TPA: hypothetical protein DDW29_13835 [Gammaproteobacteria bacterium]|nr:hypothetical protein [Gammaproteobacteria bacterium]